MITRDSYKTINIYGLWRRVNRCSARVFLCEEGEGGGGEGGGGTLYIPGGEISLANLTLGGQGRRNLIIDNTSTHLGFN